MQLTPNLEKKIAQAVQISMRIEGYQPVRSKQIKEQAKALIEKHHVQVSIQSK